MRWYFDLSSVRASGRDIGRNVYWKLYAIENVVRVIIHSVLSAQINTNWWATATDPTLQKKALGFRRKYTSRPWHTAPTATMIFIMSICLI